MSEKDVDETKFPETIYLDEEIARKYSDEPRAYEFDTEDILGVYKLVKRVKIVVKTEIVDA